jgi:hypothetical protein
MSYPASAYAGMVAIGLLSWAGGYNLGVTKGRAIEQDETRTFVNSEMTKAGFCGWFEKSRIAEDCAALTPEQGEAK